VNLLLFYRNLLNELKNKINENIGNDRNIPWLPYLSLTNPLKVSRILIKPVSVGDS
jgi:hypothetical protein